jgi:hypothetical protein
MPMHKAILSAIITRRAVCQPLPLGALGFDRPICLGYFNV